MIHYHSDIDHFWMERLLIKEKSSKLDRVRLVVEENDSSPVVNVDRLGRSIH